MADGELRRHDTGEIAVRNILSRWVVTSTVVLLLVMAAASPALARNWDRSLRKLENEIGKNEWKDALDRAVEIRSGMIEEIPSSEATKRGLARTFLWQAIAEANLGRDEDALWHWYMAQNYLEGLPGMDLSGYDRAGEVLAGHSLDAEVAPASAPADVAGDRAVQVVRPIKPRWPAELKAAGYEGAVVVKIVVGLDGKPHLPRLEDAGIVPTMAFPALEALKNWRFSPAVRAGQALVSYYQLKISYP